MQRKQLGRPDSTRPCSAALQRAITLSIFSLFLAIALSLSAPAFSATYAVGSGGFGAGCAFSTLTDALAFTQNNGVADEIRLATTTTYPEDVIVTGSDALTISGGWIGCSAATALGTTPIAGDSVSAAPTLLSSASNLTLRMLDINGAGDGALAFSSGTVSIEDVRVTGATTGVAVFGGAVVTLDADSRVFDNSTISSTVGSGIDCRDNSRVNVAAEVSNNSAVQGGGLRAEDGCFIEIFPGLNIEGNSAERGGGVYLEGNAFMGGGGGIERAVITNNVASDAGGGVYVTDSGARVSVFNTEVLKNRASVAGGGVVATNGGEFSMNRSTVVTCGNRYRCSVLSENTLTGGGATDGIAAYAAAGGSVELLQTFVEENSVTALNGRLLFAEHSGSELILEGVQIWNNKAEQLISATSSASAEAAFVSAAENEFLGTTFQDSYGADGTGGSVSIFSSILDDTSGYQGTVIPHCLITDELTGLVGGAAVDVDPQFVNPSTGDLHLRLTSPAIDFCDTAAFTPTRLDIDVETRGYDQPGVGAAGKTIDLGIDEVRVLFADGFETGNTSLWSSTVP